MSQRQAQVRGASQEPDRLLDHPAADLLHQVEALRGRQEGRRWHQRAAAVEHAQQQLVTRRAATAQVQDGLRHQYGHVLYQRLVDVLCVSHMGGRDPCLHDDVAEDGHPVATRLLHLVHRRVCGVR